MKTEHKQLLGFARGGYVNRRAFLERAAALGISAAAAGGILDQAYAETPRRGGLIRAGLQGGNSSDTLDPALNTSQVMFAFCKTWGEFINRLTPDGGLENLIAEEIGTSPDAKTWTIRVRDGIEFHNAKTVTAEDVAATIARHADERSQSGALGVLRNISDIRTNGRDVICTLAEPDAEFPYMLADYHLVVQPNGGVDDPSAGISAGPYKITANEPGIRHGGERFANYWRADEAAFADQVEIIVINDNTARVAALQSGQVHMINRVSPRVVDRIRNVPGLSVENVVGKGYYPINMFCNTAPFDNYDLRMALKLAADREELVSKILGGFGEVGNDFPINRVYPLAPEGIEQRVFDPDKAADHYRKSGHSGPILLRTSDVAFPGAVDAAQLYQQSCAKAGITIQIQREPGDGYWSEVWNKQPFCMSYWGGRATQAQMYSTGYVSDADWNDTRFTNESFDKMLLAARAELDEEKRKLIYRDMAVILRDEGGLIAPFFNETLDAVATGKIGGYKKSPQSWLMDGYALSECWLIT
ncbi:MAG TPA: ABC transporter substrate-binding protein [Paracoccaceae bacterium]|nr:ABC transporter substrate-binding protein [Paracoccaceae bacterium]